MNSLATFLAFAAVTAFFVARHARRHGVAGAPGGRCPRCGAGHASGAHACPRCRAPLHAFELVTAATAAESAGNGAGPLHAVVRADVCVGCGTCVDACAVPGALRLEHKLAVVDKALCAGHGECVAACPVGGIFMTSGESVHVLEVPELTTNFESVSQPGLYVVGELGGRSLIKNAINEGRLAMEHVARSLAAEPPVAHEDILDVIVAGAGPAGLSAALEAKHQGLSCALLEQGSFADTIAKYPRHKLLFAEPLRVPLYGNLWIADASKEALLQCWRNVIDATGLEVTTHTRVEALERAGGAWRVTAGGREWRARRIVLALGRRGTPRRLEIPGEELGHVFYDIVEMEAFANLRTLVVGGGDSAIETALGLAHQSGTTVTLSYRGREFTRPKERNRARIAEAEKAGRVRILRESRVTAIREGEAALEVAGAALGVTADAVVIRIGGEAAHPFLERAGVRIVRKALALPAHREAVGA